MSGAKGERKELTRAPGDVQGRGYPGDLEAGPARQIVEAPGRAGQSAYG